MTFLIPVSANLLGVLILSEEFHIQHLLGMFVIGIGFNRHGRKRQGQNNSKGGGRIMSLAANGCTTASLSAFLPGKK